MGSVRSAAPTLDRSHHIREQGAWLPRARVKVEDGEIYPATTPLEDRFFFITLAPWDWDYLTRPAVQRPSELWTDIWSEWPDNMEGD